MPVVNRVVTVLDPPEGYVVDFDNPQRRAVPAPYWVAGVGILLSLLFMGQRFYTKVVLMRKLQIDDVFLILSCIINYTVIGLTIDMFAEGAGGVHGWEISIDKYNIFKKDVYLAAAIYIIGGSFAKIALLIFYFRLSPQRWFKFSVWISLAFISGYTIAIFFSLIFACTPLSMNWDIRVTGGTCINQAAFYIITAVVNIVSDVFLFCLPLPIVIHLQIPKRQKIGLVLIFLLGSLTIVTSLVRVSILPEMFTSVDQPWVISWASVWIIVESNLFIICAALPTLRKFLKHVAHDLIGESAYAGGTERSQRTDYSRSSPLTTGGTISISRLEKKTHKAYSEFDLEDGAESWISRPETAHSRSDEERILGGSRSTTTL